MLSRQIQQIVNSDPDYAAIAPVIEKEILHHDIMDALVRFAVADFYWWHIAQALL